MKYIIQVASYGSFYIDTEGRWNNVRKCAKLWDNLHDAVDYCMARVRHDGEYWIWEVDENHISEIDGFPVSTDIQIKIRLNYL